MAGPAGLRIRRGRLSDAGAVSRIMRASIRGLSRGTYGAATLSRWSSLPPLYHAWAMTAGGETYLVAERRGRIEGYAALRRGEVTAVFVRPGAAGRGTGLALLRAVERLARRRGVRALLARAARGAVGFYERAGFRRAGTARVPLPGGGHLEAVVVRKRAGGERLTVSAGAPRQRSRSRRGRRAARGARRAGAS
jgi:GNAT superfamily N-acetyltransferase